MQALENVVTDTDEETFGAIWWRLTGPNIVSDCQMVMDVGLRLIVADDDASADLLLQHRINNTLYVFLGARSSAI